MNGESNQNGSPTLITVLIGGEAEWPDFVPLLTKLTKLQNVRVGVRGRVPGFVTTLARMVDGALRDILRTPLKDVLGRGWSTYGDLRKYRDVDKYPPNSTHRAVLGKHSIRSVHKPTIDVLVNEMPQLTLECELELVLAFDVAELEIRGGRIYGVGAGKCRAEGKLSCEGFELLELRSRDLQLPELFTFPEGVPIP